MFSSSVINYVKYKQVYLFICLEFKYVYTFKYIPRMIRILKTAKIYICRFPKPRFLISSYFLDPQNGLTCPVRVGNYTVL